MLELLILYSLSKQEQTLYGLRKMIAKHFGEVSIPSHGALHPSIKKLKAKNLLSLRKKFSDGGKKYTYYSTNESYLEYFNTKFMEFNNAKSESLESFLLWLKIHLIIIDLLNPELITEFKEKCGLKLSKFKTSIEEKLENKYIELTEVQKKLLNIQKQQIGLLSDIVNNL